MGSEGSDDKELFRHLGLLSNEVIQIQKTLHTIDLQESRLRSALDELALEKEILIEQGSRLEAIVKQAATSAVDDAEREREREQSMESEKSDLQARIKEMGETLRTKEAAVRELEEEFTAKMADLNGQIREKDSLLQIRDIVLTDLKAAADSLNRLVGGLSSSGDSSLLLLDQPQDNPPSAATGAIKELEERTAMEIARLRSELREKDAVLAAKSVELEMNKQAMGGKIEELEKALDSKSKRKSPRLVSLLSDMGGKKFF